MTDSWKDALSDANEVYFVPCVVANIDDSAQVAKFTTTMLSQNSSGP